MSTVAEVKEPPKAAIAANQIVAFCLGHEVYGLDISAIHTVVTPYKITSVPKTPKFIKGVINLRGQVIPILDLRARFGMQAMAEEELATSRFIIVDIDEIRAGLIVDSVSEVLTLDGTEVQPPSKLISGEESEFLAGIARVHSQNKEERIILILNVEKVLTNSSKEMEQLKKVYSQGSHIA